MTFRSRYCYAIYRATNREHDRALRMTQSRNDENKNGKIDDSRN
jgi:hypothetical protein